MSSQNLLFNLAHENLYYFSNPSRMNRNDCSLLKELNFFPHHFYAPEVLNTQFVIVFFLFSFPVPTLFR